MLQHIHHDTEGQAGDVVTLTSRVIPRIRINQPCSSGIQFGADGILYLIQNNGGTSAVIGEWLANGVASDFYVSRTIDSGTLVVDAGAGPLQLNANRGYQILRSTIGIDEATITCTLSNDISGLPILATATYDFKAEYSTGA